MLYTYQLMSTFNATKYTKANYKNRSNLKMNNSTE